MTNETTDSSSLSEEEQMQLKKRKKLTRSCMESSQLRQSNVHTSNQETPTHRPASSPTVSKLGEKIRSNLEFSVTCGGRKGLLHKEKFNNSEPCIFSQSQWFTPTQFEKFGGLERHKKWKTSIFYHGVALQTFIQEGFLSSPSFKLRRIQDEEPQCRKTLFTPNGNTRHVTNGHTTKIISRSESNSMISSDDDDGEDDHADLTQFLGETFPVTCSAGRGTLHKSRFATGRCGRCIRTEDSWLTPEKFLDLNMRGGNWRQHITSHGKPLGTLIMRRVLEPHAVNCACPSCKGENSVIHPSLLDEKNDDQCSKCNSEGDLVCCDKCPRSFHPLCHKPPIQDTTLGDDWICSFCTAARNQP